MKEYDSIILVRRIPSSDIPVGTKGVIVMVFETPSKAYEVELFDDSMDSLGTFTVVEDDIRLRNG